MDPLAISLPIYSETTRFEVSRELGHTQFACDLNACHGACCTMPAEAGAPILESEIAELERVFPIVKKYLSKDSLATIEREGIWKREPDGSITIPAIRGRDCIFVTYDDSPSLSKKGTGGGIAYCAIEKAHREGEIEGFPKPISCHLFPIRIYPTSNSPSFSRRGPGDGSREEQTFEIVYESIPECKGGRTRGKKERMPLIEFLESPLVRALGEERVNRLKQAFDLKN